MECVRVQLLLLNLGTTILLTLANVSKAFFLLLFHFFLEITDVAAVEFLSKEEWKKELEVLFNDMRGEDGVMVKKHDPRSGGGIALTKIRVFNRIII